MNHELRYIINGDTNLPKMFNGISRHSGSANRALDAHRKKVGLFKNELRSATSQIPMLGSAMSMATNPIVVGAAAIGLVTKGLIDSSRASDEFMGNFRELQNLNLDKTRSEVKKLRDDVMDTAFREGFNPNATSTGFYDIQSITGKYGAEVERIVSKQGLFAKLMRADFTEWISGSGKAMANYGFGENQLDGFNRSAYATVKVGSITFDQLAKVQSDYAGAASAAKQDFDSANKLLTLFTVKTKSYNEAGTLTKSAFTDLFKESSLKAFEKAGVKMFDPITGGARQVDKIMLDLNKKFSGINGDKAINDLRNQFKGSEGLIALVQAAADQTGNLQKTLNAFNASKMDTDKAISNALNDPNYLNKELKNKVLTMKVNVGNDLLPAKNYLLERRLAVMEGWHTLFQSRDSFFAEAEKKRQTQRAEKRNPSGAFKLFAENNTPWQYQAIGGKILDFNPNAGNSSNKPTSTTADDDAAIKNNINAISGGGVRDKHIHIHIDNMIKEMAISAQSLPEASEEIEAIIKETMVRALQGTEQIIGNN